MLPFAKQHESSSGTRRALLGAGAAVLMMPSALRAAQSGPGRILHVMSFESPWRWTDGQFIGFKEGLGLADVEYRVFQMDVKRNKTPEAKEAVARDARAIIDSWKPDLVYASDDDAQAFVTRHYVDATPVFVFSGVNKTPAAHGLQGAKNVAGVLEREHFVETARLLQSLRPQIQRFAVISDMGLYWPDVIARIRSGMAQLPGARLAAVDRVSTFAAYPAIADAVFYLGIFTFVDASGNGVRDKDVQRWTVENSLLPDASFWIDRIHYGVLASVTVSEHEQGRAAGRLARAILVDGKAPDALPMEATLKGNPAINLARARQIGIAVPSSVLLSSEVVTDFEWMQN
jgi:ABC transporter substrate binding protein